MARHVWAGHAARPGEAGGLVTTSPYPETASRVVATSARPGSIFVTGGSGFIGRRFLSALQQDGFERVTCLSRNPGALAAYLRSGSPSGSTPTPASQWKYLAGDLASPEAWSSHLSQVDAVVHLAAATGNATTEELKRVNVDATRRLLHECERHGVSRMLYVSSIAAKYRELDGYAYGRSKLQAEAAVRESRIDYTILRPTIVLGPDSPIWRKLRSLATLPLPVVLGDGKTRVQPIGVDDVARGMALLLARSRFSGEILELGGTDVVTFEELIRRIRTLSHKSAAPVLHLPVIPISATLRLLGGIFGSHLPVSAGQLVPFTNDGVADPSDLAVELRPRMIPLDELLDRLASDK
jgi:nucleoside-diphosphate-sugar epimerase